MPKGSGSSPRRLHPRRAHVFGLSPGSRRPSRIPDFLPSGYSRLDDTVEGSVRPILSQNAGSMRAKTNSARLDFAWLVAPKSPRKRIKSRIRRSQWPPRIGRKLAFRTDFGIQMRILREIKHGLMCRQYAMADGRIAMEHQLVMSAPGPWRHPDTVSEVELKSCIARVSGGPRCSPRHRFQAKCRS